MTGRRLRGGFGPPFHALAVAGALAGALAAIILNGYGGWWLGAALPWLLLRRARLGLPGVVLTVFVLLWLLWLALQVLWLNPAWQPKAAYFAGTLLSGFVIVSALPVARLYGLARLGVAVALLLALWGLVQYFTGVGVLVPMGGRANASFYTPNSLASFLNLFLLPLTALYLLAGRSWHLAAVLLLFAALLATASRGGLLAWGAGMVALLGLLGAQAWRGTGSRTLRLAVGLMLTASLMLLLPGAGPSAAGYEDRMQELLAQGDSIRLVLWDIAWRLVREAPLIGHGYYNFHYFQLRDSYGPQVGYQTRYVHNDYLQFWAETGSIGLLLFLAVLLAAVWALWRHRGRLHRRARALFLACGAGLATVYAHAFVDFPFWPPALLLVIGAQLGMVARLHAAAVGAPPLFASAHAGLLAAQFRPVVLKGLLGAALCLFLALPWVAQEASRLGVRRAREGDAQAALFWLRLAQAVQPRDPYFHWREGLIWGRVAFITRQPEHAARADAGFARAMAVHPYDIESVALRLILHRDHRDWLSAPAAPEELLRWSEFLERWMPHHPRYRVERINTLAWAGRAQEAAAARRAFAALWPALKLEAQPDGGVRFGKHIDPFVVPDADLPKAHKD